MRHGDRSAALPSSAAHRDMDRACGSHAAQHQSAGEVPCFLVAQIPQDFTIVGCLAANKLLSAAAEASEVADGCDWTYGSSRPLAEPQANWPGELYLKAGVSANSSDGGAPLADAAAVMAEGLSTDAVSCQPCFMATLVASALAVAPPPLPLSVRAEGTHPWRVC